MALKPPTRTQPHRSAKSKPAGSNNNSARSSALVSTSSCTIATTADGKNEDSVRADIGAPSINDDQGSTIIDDYNLASISKITSAESFDDVQ
ncbi:hypothetical protein BGZ95_000785 [Linnemannia exigua]|uniref:Uncharacterized protein n=1 Tax=Linnemannia exigua TaxID=604196 RepID=A0AAD4DKT4_9FUNG|nr:hypothetical protein BGZ95_000785 [Linnemannia exigua]